MVLGILLVVYLNHINRVSFFGDESWWINMSASYEPFITGNITSPIWNESIITYYNPPLTCYVIGLFRRLGGFSDTNLNSRWDYSFNEEQNIAMGSKPGPGLLWWSRLPMAILGAITGFIIFILLRKGIGVLSAYFFLVFYITNNYLLTILRRAMNEAPLIALVTLAMLLAVFAVRSGTKSRLYSKKIMDVSLLLFISMSIVGGMAGAVKYNGLLIIFASIILNILTILATKVSFRFNIISGISTICSFIVTGFMVFTLLNPFLYTNSLNRIYKLFQFRIETMNNQTKEYGSLWKGGVQKSMQTVSSKVFYDYASIRILKTQFINMVLCVIGIYTLGYSTYQWVVKNKKTYTSAVILVFGLILAIPSLFTPLDWDRYYLLPVFFSTVFIAVGLAEVSKRALIFVYKRRQI